MNAAGMLIALLFAAGAPDTRPDATPVTGPSWIQHLGVELDDTPMGKMGGDQAPPAGRRREPLPTLEGGPYSPYTITGSDLYRIDCRSCHGPKEIGRAHV